MSTKAKPKDQLPADHYCGNEMRADGKCAVCGGPDPR